MKGPFLSSHSGKSGGDKKQQIRDRAVEPHMKAFEDMKIDPDLKATLKLIEEEMGGSNDVIVKEITLIGEIPFQAAVLYIQGLVDDNRLNEHVLEPVQRARLTAPAVNADETLNQINKSLLQVGDVEAVDNWAKVFQSLFVGNTILFVDGLNKAISAGTIGGPKRDVTEPQTNMVIRGPREGFTESIRTNSALLRRKIRSPKLWLDQRTIGSVTQTPVGIMYVKGIADDSLIEELSIRLDAISIDGVLESGYIEELISDQKITPFPTIFYNERPDVIAAGLLEGRIAILVDGTPFVLMAPATFNVFFQAAEDYYQRYDISTFLRMLRFLSFAMALMLPSVYVAIVGYHQEMIPTPLLLKLAAQREGVPFPAYVEAFMMEIIFEVLREAVVRMPIAVGNTISIVGGLVIGQSVVEAGFFSPAVVIIVSLTAITSFVSPAYNLAIAARLLRFGLLIAAASLGFYGIALIVLALLLHLTSLRTLGVPYLKPFAPLFWKDMKDSIIRVPFWMMKQRPQGAAPKNKVRESTDINKSKGGDS
ncbi:spore germination protein [Paenibacillus sepulcri]|uniref:Spore germination protein n=1 Tax=Paenibacillus sepulcri TaxID=359917 RepID=A0ABS7C2E5_9BACL|nr:spore germination protein [Paenibacillus sepulcri]